MRRAGLLPAVSLMPEWVLVLLPGALSGAAAALGSMAAMKAGMKGLYKRIARLENHFLHVQRDLGRLEGCLDRDLEVRQ